MMDSLINEVFNTERKNNNFHTLANIGIMDDGIFAGVCNYRKLRGRLFS